MRLIDADALKMEDFRHCLDCDSIIQVIKHIPTIDAVPVVRCADCWKSADGLCSYQLKNVPGKDFCGDGERRSDD